MNDPEPPVGSVSWRVVSVPSVTLGLADAWTTDDEPVVNPDFLADYGFGNNATLDGEGTIQATYTLP